MNEWHRFGSHGVSANSIDALMKRLDESPESDARGGLVIRSCLVLLYWPIKDF